MYMAVLIYERPPRIIRFPLYEPLSRLKGATPTNDALYYVIFDFIFVTAFNEFM